MIKITKIFIANVGVNTDYENKYGIKSPIFSNGTFEFIPIKESDKIKGEHFLKYQGLKCYNSDERLIKFFPKSKRQILADYYVHNDPEFDTFTYGDYIPKKKGRGINLTNVKRGDFLFFIVRLVQYREGYFLSGSGAFYFIGYLVIDKLIIEEKDILAHKELIHNNPHYKWYIDKQEDIGDYLIIKGPKESKRFKHAFRVTREFCDACFRDTYGNKFDWGKNQTENQRIGSYTRTPRAFIDNEKNSNLWNHFWQFLGNHK